MVEVSPKKGDIQIHLGWLFFALFAIVAFAVLFYFVPGDPAWYRYVLIGGVVVAAAIDLWVFKAPAPFVILVLLASGIYAVVWKYYLSVAH